jgi:hypothetical protein
LFSFVLSAGAAALAINLYALLRTGRVGASWRVLIIASVMFALSQAVRLAEVLNVPLAAELHLSSIVELAFAITLLYAFYLQRQVFVGETRPESHEEFEEEEEEEEPVVSAYERYS